MRQQGLDSKIIYESMRLLSEEGLQLVRQELSEDTLVAQCAFSSERTPSVYRGTAHVSECLRKLWRSDEIKTILSDAFGYLIEPHPMNYELAHINLQPKDLGHGKPVDDWHRDSYPLVCIVMLSDAESMEGGELVIKDGLGQEIALRFPKAGYAIILQGQHVPHCARAATNTDERMTMVTSLIPSILTKRDMSSLAMSVNYSDKEKLSEEWITYRLEQLKKRADIAQESLSISHTLEEKIRWCEELTQDLIHTKTELLHCKPQR